MNFKDFIFPWLSWGRSIPPYLSPPPPLVGTDEHCVQFWSSQSQVEFQKKRKWLISYEIRHQKRLYVCTYSYSKYLSTYHPIKFLSTFPMRVEIGFQYINNDDTRVCWDHHFSLVLHSIVLNAQYIRLKNLL